MPFRTAPSIEVGAIVGATAEVGVIVEVSTIVAAPDAPKLVTDAVFVPETDLVNTAILSGLGSRTRSSRRSATGT